MFGILGGIKESFPLLLFYISEKIVFSIVFLTMIILNHLLIHMYIPICSMVSFVIDLFFLKELYLRKKQNKLNLYKNNCKNKMNNLNVNVINIKKF